MVDSTRTEGSDPRKSRFTEVDGGTWAERVSRDLKGRAVSELVDSEVDGLQLEPLYTAGGASGPPVEWPSASWQISVLVDASKPEAAVEAAHNAAAQGAEAILLRIAHSRRKRGVPLGDLTELEAFCTAIGDTDLEVHLDAGAAANSMLGARSRNLRTMGLDPMAALAQGAERDEFEALLAGSLQELASARDGHHGATPLAIDTSFYHGAGASHAQEVGFALASAIEMARRADGYGVPPEETLKLMGFRMAVGTDFMKSLAKLRAARLCWRQIGEVLRSPVPMTIHALPSSLHQTSRAKWVNVLRNTAYCFAASLGGADRITLTSHEVAADSEGAFGRRLACNTQHVLRLESRLDQVRDPAAGSYYLESLSLEIAEHAWRLFQEIEGQGGMLQSLRSGWVGDAVAALRARRLDALSKGTSPILGVTLYPEPQVEEALREERAPEPGPGIHPRPLELDVAGEGP